MRRLRRWWCDLTLNHFGQRPTVDTSGWKRPGMRWADGGGIEMVDATACEWTCPRCGTLLESVWLGYRWTLPVEVKR